MKNKMTLENVYNDMLIRFSDTLKETSKDEHKADPDKYMTSCDKEVINFDRLKNGFVKNMALTRIPKSCDALYMYSPNEIFMIEFKNGVIEAKKNYEINVKILESFILLCEQFSETARFMRNNLTFVLVYNENVKHGAVQFEDTGYNKITNAVFALARERLGRFGLHRFKKLYFKDVFTYSKAEFQSEFVDKFCVQS